MTIDESIRRLESFRDVYGWRLSPDILNSINLGIEALKRVRGERTGYESYAPDLLPGETT